LRAAGTPDFQRNVGVGRVIRGQSRRRRVVLGSEDYHGSVITSGIVRGVVGDSSDRRT
jgi:hypothetical protein